MLQAILYILAHQLRLLEQRVEIRVGNLDRVASKAKAGRHRVVQEVQSDSEEDPSAKKKEKKDKKAKVFD